MAVNNAPHPVACARLEGVQFGYRRGVRVVDGLDLEIPNGRTVLLGPNGAGKTTLLGLLTGPLVPRRGRVCLTGGQSARGRWARRHVGHLPQSVPHVRGLTVVEQIAFAGWLTGMRRAQAAAAASEWVMRLDLDDVARRPASALSGGQRRRMGWLRRWCTRPILQSWMSRRRAWIPRNGGSSVNSSESWPPPSRRGLFRPTTSRTCQKTMTIAWFLGVILGRAPRLSWRGSSLPGLAATNEHARS